MVYKTKQKSFVLDCLKKHPNESLSADKIAEYLKADGVTVGTATIYRHLSKLCEDKYVRKFVSSDNESANYRYIDKDRGCNDHFHLVCTKCGELIHLECNSIDNVYKHIFSEHGFKVDTQKTVFYGLCKKCRD